MKQESDSPFPETAGVIRDQAIIKRAAFMYLTCKPCECLGWKNGCPGKDKCGAYFYACLEKHFLEWENAKCTTRTFRH